MTTWAPELMFAKLFELFGKEWCFFGTLFTFAVAYKFLLLFFLWLCLPPALCRARISRRQPYCSHCLFRATSSPAVQVGAEQMPERFKIVRDSGKWEFGLILITLRATGVVEGCRFFVSHAKLLGQQVDL